MISSPPQALEPALPATVGRYKVVRVIGEGAMGRVLLAHDPVLARDVAVKHLRGDLKIPRDVRHGLITRMRHEARAAARVAHPNLVVLHDMGEDAEIGLYLVFEYVEGPTLKQRIAEGPMPAAEVARLARELGDALTTAHDAGILHRDVKPENVILARKGGKIADFGIARIPDSTLTHQGGLMGTPAYSAPETFRAGSFSPESDQFSLGASLYEALSGRRAFPGDDAVAVAAKIAHDAPEPLARRLDLPQAVDDVFARALAKKPEDRFPSCAAFGDALAESVVASRSPHVDPLDPAAPRDPLLPPPASPATPPSNLPPHERRSGQVVLGAAVVVATAALLLRSALHGAESGPTEPIGTVAVPTASATATAPRVRAPAGTRVPRVQRGEPAAAGSSAADAGSPAPSASATSSATVPDAIDVVDAGRARSD